MSKAAIVVPAVEQQAAAIRPEMITISERTELAFAAATVLCRQGWQFFDQIVPDVFPAIGQTTLVLVKGNPNARATEIAEAAESYATVRAQADYDKAVASAAALLLEDVKRAERQAALQAEIADAEKTLRNAKDRLSRA